MTVYTPPPAPGTETYTWYAAYRLGGRYYPAGYCYKYTDSDGTVFSTFGGLADCRARRDRWLAERKGADQ